MAFPNLARAGLAPHRVHRIYLFWPGVPTAWVEVGPTLDRKIEALRCHASQIHDSEAVFNRVRGRLAEQGAQIGVDAAEAYRLVVIDRDPIGLPGS